MTNFKMMIIYNAILWAAIMISSALITTGALDKDDRFMLLMIHLVGWTVTNGWLIKMKKQQQPK